ncbi:MAG TPA: PAS domain S-box protein [Burkholderiales bacterium]|nr:PAS domain S-box protein [Burkholderiales bacterium]
MGLSVILVLAGSTAAVLVLLRGEALARAGRNLGNLAAALAEQTRQSVRAVELAAQATAKDLEELPTVEQRRLRAQLLQRMQDRMAVLPNVRVLAFLDARGTVVLHSPPHSGPEINFGDREHVRAHFERRIEGLHVGEPVPGRLVPGWLNVFSRRVESAGGGLLGVVVVGVAAPYFDDAYSALDLGAEGRVFLFRTDGVLLAVHPEQPGALGRSFAQDSLFRQALAQAGAGSQWRTGLLDGRRRLLAYQRLRDYPLVVVVSSTEDFVLSAWRRDAWYIGAGAAGVGVLIALAMLLLLRSLRTSAALAHELQETGERLRGIIASAMDAIITVDEDQNIVLFNEAAEKIFRCRAAEAVGCPLDRFIPERFRAAHREHVRRFGETGQTTRTMGARLALYGLRADGEEFPIDASISQITTGGRKFYTVILRDITERRRAEQALERSYEELRELSAAMNEVREAERMRIARELHDELAQWLTALKMDVSWLASRLPKSEAPLLEKTEKMKALVDSTVMAVRRIAADLRPVMLDDLGLVPAVEHLLHELSQRTGLLVALDADPDGFDFGEPFATSVYRMVQEALTNVARHAAATEVRVLMRREGENLVVRVRDNGRGYDPQVAARRKSYGLLGIRERARTLGGDARIARLEEGGTLVEIVIPAARYRARRG